MGSCAAPSAKGDDKFITTDYLQQCHPGDARKRARTGTAVVTFTVNTEGTIVSSFLEISSGTFSLDREAIAVLERAQPLPKPPPEILEGGLFKVKMPITFKLKE
nr:energy transducer TonB [Escherichia coli]